MSAEGSPPPAGHAAALAALGVPEGSIEPLAGYLDLVAAWNERTPDSWEHVMPYRATTLLRRTLVAGGYAVRVLIPSRGTGRR